MGQLSLVNHLQRVTNSLGVAASVFGKLLPIATFAVPDHLLSLELHIIPAGAMICQNHIAEKEHFSSDLAYTLSIRSPENQLILSLYPIEWSTRLTDINAGPQALVARWGMNGFRATMRRILLAAVFALMPLAAMAQDWDKANAAQEAGDFTTHAKELRLLAEQGQPRAQLFLGFSYILGEGVPKDLVTAHIWFCIAAANGYENGSMMCDVAAEQMTPEQIAEAQRRARVCVESNYKDCD